MRQHAVDGMQLDSFKDRMSHRNGGNPMCRFCLSEEDTDDSPLIAACGCAGTSRWVHTHCLLSWVQAVLERAGDPSHCELCKQPFLLDGVLQAGNKWCHAVYLGGPFWTFVLLFIGVSIIQILFYSAFAGQLAGHNLFRHFFTFPFFIIIMACYIGGVCQKRLLNSALLAILAIFVMDPLVERSWMASGGAIQELRPGIILRFNQPTGGGVFSKSVVLVTNYSYSFGAVGYIINKDTKPLGPFGPDNPKLAKVRYGYGGPVSGARWDILHWDKRPTAVRDASATGVEFVYVGGRGEDLHAALTSKRTDPPSNFHAIFVRGHAGWGPAQLDAEIRRGDWTIHNATASLIFETPPSQMFRAVSEVPSEGKRSGVRRGGDL